MTTFPATWPWRSPPLRAMRVPATFFLSGRALHGRGAYWFQRLELLLMTRGPREIAARVGVPDSGGAALVLACERDLTIRRKIVDLAAGGAEPSVLGRAQIAELAAAGVTIGFHTVEHPVLPDLPDDALPAAVCEGRDELAAAAGGRLRFFAYPHGKTNARAAQAVRRAGFEAAFTGRPESVRAGQDPYTIGRWEPGPIPVEQLLVKLAIYLHRPVQRQP